MTYLRQEFVELFDLVSKHLCYLAELGLFLLAELTCDYHQMSLIGQRKFSSSHESLVDVTRVFWMEYLD